MSYADEEMRMIAKQDGKHLLMSIDNKSGSEYYTYELNDEGSILIEDLIWILQQIEHGKGLWLLFIFYRPIGAMVNRYHMYELLSNSRDNEI